MMRTWYHEFNVAKEELSISRIATKPKKDPTETFFKFAFFLLAS